MTQGARFGRWVEEVLGRAQSRDWLSFPVFARFSDVRSGFGVDSWVDRLPSAPDTSSSRGAAAQFSLRTRRKYRLGQS